MSILIFRRRHHTVPPFLVFSTQPGGANSGSAFSPQPVVTAKNPDGSTNTSFTGNVTLAVNTVTGSHALGGTVTVAAVAGVATFSGVTDTGSGNGTLTASATGYTSATSASFTSAAGGTTVYGSDAFTDTDNTIAHSHTPVAVGTGPAFSSLVDINGANSVFRILNNRLSVVGAAVGAVYRIGWTTASVAPSAQTVKGNLIFLSDETQLIAIGACCDVAGGNVGGYFLQWAAGVFKLLRCDDAFDSTQLGSNYTYAFAPGTVPFEITHNGSGGLTVKINGVANAITATDASPLTGRSVECMVLMSGSTTTFTSAMGIVPDDIVLQAP